MRYVRIRWERTTKDERERRDSRNHPWTLAPDTTQSTLIGKGRDLSRGLRGTRGDQSDLDITYKCRLALKVVVRTSFADRWMHPSILPLWLLLQSFMMMM